MNQYSYYDSAGAGLNMRRIMVFGFVIWLLASIVLRFVGQYVFHPDSPMAIALLLLASFPLMAIVTRRICADARVPREQWPTAAISFILPSLLLDTFSTTFFATVYPNITPAAAGLFGGWILWCCGGALAGVSFARNEEVSGAAPADSAAAAPAGR